MTTLLIFMVFAALFFIGQVGMNRIGSYENRYGAMTFIGIAGMFITGWVAFFMSFLLWSFVIIVAIYVFLRYVRSRIFG